MNRLNPVERMVYVNVMSQVIAQIVNKGRAKPAGTAHRAAEFAMAAIQETRIQFGRKK